jgi:plastocyanin
MSSARIADRTATRIALFGLLALTGQVALAADVTGSVKLPDGAKPGQSKDGKTDETASVLVWVEGTSATPIAAQPPKDAAVISQKGTQFSPRFSAVVVGQTVTMPNDDNIAHNVYSKSTPKAFNLGVYQKGEAKDVTFDKSGRVDLLCSMHRQMSAIIYVVPNEHFSLVKEDGSFTIAGLNPGTYTLKAFQKDCGEFSQEFTVPAIGNATATVELSAKK